MKKYERLCYMATLLAFLISTLGSHRSMAQAAFNSQIETTVLWTLLLINERFYYGLDVWDFQRNEPYFDIQGFLDNQPGKLKEMSFSNQEGNETKASEVIQNISKSYGVNPKIILALIELRTGSITGTLGALDKLSPEAQHNEAEDFEKQIHWVIDALSEAYFLRLEYNLATITFKDGDSFQVPSDLNAGSFAIYSFFAQYFTKEEWHTEQVADDFLNIYAKWFGDPRIEISETELPSFWNKQPVGPMFDEAPQSCPNAPFARPTTGNLTSTYRDATGSYSPDNRHRGTDISDAIGTPVYAAYGGNLTHVGDCGIRIIHEELPGDWQNKVPARNTQTYYTHLSARRAPGRVEKGDWIGSQGWCGLSDPAYTHLHVSIGIPWQSEDPGTPENPKPWTMDNVHDPSAYFGACLNYDKGVRKTYQPILCCGSITPSDPRNLTFELCNERIAWQTKHRQADSIGEIVVDGISGWSGRITGYAEYDWNEGLWFLQGGLEGNQTYGISFDVKYLGQGDSSPAYVALKSFAGCATKGPYDIDVGSGTPVRRSIQVTLDNCNDYYLIFGERYAGQYLIDNILIEGGAPNVPPNPPSLQSPADGSNQNYRAVSFSWQDNGDPDNYPRDYRDYDIEVWKSGWLVESGWILSTDWSTTVPEDGVYSWHVKSGDGELPSEWSETRDFRVDTTAPSKASNVRPNGWTGPYTSDTTPAFAWNAATDGG
ncbi:MAG: M23 family metallopeptidase, partial [Anaerolineae bacterium]|nr:M23 family metallopeptidase [Anaerolineae bacterium]